VPAVVLAYSLLMSTIGVAAAATDVTTWAFALDSMIPNGLFTTRPRVYHPHPHHHHSLYICPNPQF